MMIISTSQTNNNTNSDPSPSSEPAPPPLPLHHHHPTHSLFKSSSSHGHRQSNHLKLAHLPTELLIEIFSWLPSLRSSQDKRTVSLVCRNWTAPARIVLWRELWLSSCEAVECLSRSLSNNPTLGNLPRRLRFQTDDPNYLVNLSADAVFNAMSKLSQLEAFEVLVPYAGGELYDSLCEDLLASPVKRVILGAQEGIGRRHVQASMRFDQLEYLELIKLGELEDLRTLELEWIYPNSLHSLVLMQPEIPPEDFRFLLSHVKPTLKTLRIDFGPLFPPFGADDGILLSGLTEEDLRLALLESGTDLEVLELKWPNCRVKFLNEVIKACWNLSELITSGHTCDPFEIFKSTCSPHYPDRTGRPSLSRFEFDVKLNQAPENELVELSEAIAKEATKGRSRVRTSYYLRTAPRAVREWEDECMLSLDKLVTHEDQLRGDLERAQRRPNRSNSHAQSSSTSGEEGEEDEWNLGVLESWKRCAELIQKGGISIEGDFF